MRMLGPTLMDLAQFCGGKLSDKTTFMVGLQLVKRLEDLHARRLIHQDIKPQNITVGVGDRSKNVYLIDFGLAEYYKNEENIHVEQVALQNVIGTCRYAPIDSHKLKQ